MTLSPTPADLWTLWEQSPVSSGSGIRNLPSAAGSRRGQAKYPHRESGGVLETVGPQLSACEVQRPLTPSSSHAWQHRTRRTESWGHWVIWKESGSRWSSEKPTLRKRQCKCLSARAWVPHQKWREVGPQPPSHGARVAQQSCPRRARHQTCTDLDSPPGRGDVPRPSGCPPVLGSFVDPLAEMGLLETQDIPPGPGLPSGTASGSVLGAPPCGSTCDQRGGHCTAENGQDGPRSLPP